MVLAELQEEHYNRQTKRLENPFQTQKDNHDKAVSVSGLKSVHTPTENAENILCIDATFAPYLDKSLQLRITAMIRKIERDTFNIICC